MGDEPKSTVMGSAPNAAERGSTYVIVFEKIDGSHVGEAGHTMGLTKISVDVKAGDMAISILNFVEELSFGHCEV